MSQPVERVVTAGEINQAARTRLSVTAWVRLEPRARTADPDAGLQARVHDPLWLLGRQWQFGEFEGRDAGSPVVVRTDLVTTRVSAWLPTVPPSGHSPGLPYDSDQQPLEVLVEREPPPAAPGLRQAAQAGGWFLRLLVGAGMAKYRQAFISAFPLPALDADALAGDPAAARLGGLLAGRLPDGGALAAALERSLHPPGGGSPALPAAPPVEQGDAAAVIGVARSWLDWYRREVAPPSPGYSWTPERMEHRFTISAPDPAGSGEVVLSSPEYRGTGLDWHDFSVRSDVLLGATGPRQPSKSLTLPAPVTFPGAPAERWWEFEDAAVDLGSIDAAPDDLARLLLVEFATVFGNDWSIVPVRVPFGSLTHVLALVVTDTFGEHTLVQPSDRAQSRGGPWRMFRLSGPETARGAGSGVESLFLPPALVGVVEGPTQEEVLLICDEAADMAWAIEHVVQGPTGDPRSRDDEWQQRLAATAAVEPGPPLAPLAYRLATTLPDHWIPLLPVQDAERAVRLQRGAMLRFGSGSTAAPIEPRGRLLEPGQQVLRLYEEEVPREGTRLVRVPSMARWLGGGRLVWIARRKGTGRGEGSSGLRYDRAEIVH